MVFLTACTGVWADTVTILIKEGAVVYNRLRGRGRTCFHGPTDCQAE